MAKLILLKQQFGVLVKVFLKSIFISYFTRLARGEALRSLNVIYF